MSVVITDSSTFFHNHFQAFIYPCRVSFMFLLQDINFIQNSITMHSEEISFCVNKSIFSSLSSFFQHEISLFACPAFPTGNYITFCSHYSLFLASNISSNACNSDASLKRVLWRYDFTVGVNNMWTDSGNKISKLADKRILYFIFLILSL